MLIGQKKSFLPLSVPHGFELHLIELDHFLLLVMHPTRENREQQLPGLQDEFHA